jgi:hypothetical protein
LSVDVREDVKVRGCTLVMAALATAALEQAVLAPGRSRGLALLSTAAILVAPTLATAWFLARPASQRFRGAFVTGSALLVLFALPFLFEAARLIVAGHSAMLEITLLAALRNLGLGLAASVHRPLYARLSALVSLFLVTVASPLGGESGLAVLAPIGGFAVAGTLWLMLVY